MAKKNVDVDPVSEKLDVLIRVAQDLFILHALQAGLTSHEVRKILRVNVNRATNINRYLKKYL